MADTTSPGSRKHPVVDIPTSLVIRIGKSAEMDGFLSKLAEDVKALQEDIKQVAKGSKFRFKLEVHSPKGVVNVHHSIDIDCKSIVVFDCEGGNGGD